jgi:hypothetical protein
MKSKIQKLKKFVEGLELIDNFVFGVEYLNEHRAAVLFNKIDEEVNRIILEATSDNSEFSDLQERLGKMKNNKSFEGLETYGEEYLEWLLFLKLVSEIRCSLYKRVIQENLKINMTAIGKLEYIFYPKLAIAINNFHQKWIQDSGSKIPTSERLAKNFTHQFSESVLKLRENKL